MQLLLPLQMPLALGVVFTARPADANGHARDDDDDDAVIRVRATGEQTSFFG